MNQTLEAMARAIFKSWFVDFDPVRKGLEPFPQTLWDSRLGWLPSGWNVGSFLDMVEVIGGGTPKTTVPEYWGGGIPWFSVADAPLGGDVFVIATQENISEVGLASSAARLLPFGATIITARGTVGKIALVGEPMAMNQSCYGLIGRAPFFTYFSTQRLLATLRQRVHGSVFDTITRDTLTGVEVVIPPGDLMLEFDRVVSPSLMRVLANLKENRILAAIRDALLPKLLSGEVRVKQAEKMVGEVV
jgi:type I restriction enzyme S subunit